MMITKYEFRGEKDGISLLILAAVHGNETAGTQACFRIIDEFNRGALRLTGGHLTLVPVCNPEAYRKDVRSIDENLNRVIKMHDNLMSRDWPMKFVRLSGAIVLRWICIQRIVSVTFLLLFVTILTIITGK